MQKKTRSLLEELESIGQNRDVPHIVESRGNHIISSALNLIEYIQRNYSDDQAQLLEKKLLSSIRGRDNSRFTKTIKKIANIEFLTFSKFSSDKKEVPFNEYPTTNKVYNSVLDIKRKLHLFTKTPKSKCYHAAGWYTFKQGSEEKAIFCPKYIFIQRYAYQGPFKTEEEAEALINSL